MASGIGSFESVATTSSPSTTYFRAAARRSSAVTVAIVR